MQTYAGGGGHFGEYAIALQRYGVIARLCDFLLAEAVAPESRLRVFFLAAGVSHLTDYGHYGDVEEVTYAGAFEMSVTESDYG